MLILKRPWTSQPQAPVRLDQRHWAAGRVVWAVGPWLSPWYDHKLGSNAGFSLSASTASRIVTPIGIGVNFNSAAYYSSTENPLMYPLAWLTVGIGSTSTTNYAIGGAGNLSLNDSRWQIDNYGGNLRTVIVDTSSAHPGAASSTKTTADGEPYTAMFTVDSAKVCSVYFKGIKNSAPALGGTAAGWNGYRIGAIPYGAVQGEHSKPMLLNVLFSGQLSDAEAFSLIQNPWQLFAPQRRYIPTAAAAASTYTLSSATYGALTATTVTPRVTVTVA